MVFEARIEYLKKLIKEQDRIKNDAVELANQHLGLVHTVEKMEEIKKEAQSNLNKNQLAIKDKVEEKNEDKFVKEKVEENNWKSFELKLDVIDNFPNSLHPHIEKHENYNSLTINNVLHLLIYDPNKNPCLLNTTKYFSSDNKEGYFIITNELKNLLSGKGSDNIKEIKKYLQILYYVNLKGKITNYEKRLRNKLPEDEKKLFRGNGVTYDDDEIIGNSLHLNNNDKKEYISKAATPLIHFLPDNPILLFIELRKLLAAKKAGHDNTYNQVNAILKRLLETNIITSEKYKKILEKHYN